MSEPSNQPEEVTGCNQLRKDLFKLIDRYEAEYDFTAYQIIGMLEDIKSDFLDRLHEHLNERKDDNE